MDKVWRLLTTHKLFFISLFCAVVLATFRYSQGTIQQDDYVNYAMQLPTNVDKLSFYDTRLFPGLPILIYIISKVVGYPFLVAYVITLLSFTGSYFLLYEMTGSKLSIMPLIFPPIVLNLATIICSEMPFIFLILLSIYLIKKNALFLAFLTMGVSVWFRLAGFAVLFGVAMYLLLKRDLKGFFVSLPFFAFSVVILMLFNVHFFGAGNPFYQLFTYGTLHPGRISIGIIQLSEDLVRAFRWGWYRILFSGLAYIALFSFLYLKSFKLLKNHPLEFWIITGLYVFTLFVNLVPFLENLGRYLAPTISLFWLIFHHKFKSEKWLYLFIPISILVVLA